MNRQTLSLTVFFFLSVFFTLSSTAFGEDPKGPAADKALCEKMIRFGKEAYLRGKYLDAKEYFRKAVQADPASQEAWQYYDLASVFALAEKVEQNADLITPGQSTREMSGAGTTGPPPPAPAQAPVKKPAFKIVDDEGC
jgi:hypothetical protein